MSEERLNGLLSAWQEQQRQGRDVSAAELCRAHPELEPELERRIRALRQPDDLLGQGAETLPTSPPPSEFATLVPAPRAATPAGDGLRIPGHEILGELGRGGMGVVYRARQTRLGRVVALKMILSGAHAGEADLARFRTEAEAIARLQHPNIVQVFEVGEYAGLPFFSLEYCGGGSLERKLGGTPLPPKEAAALVEALARAMQAAHEKGVIHRDLKPANVLLAEDGTPKITDFGLAKKLDEAGHTATGAVMGTPSYMAPEQAGGKSAAIGPACDIYALGAILYESLTGRPPFRGPSAMDTVMQVVADEPVPPRQLQSRTPKDLETICLKCLQKDPARRYQSALALAEDLQRFQAGEPILARPVGRLERTGRWCRRYPAVTALLVLLALFSGVMLYLFDQANGLRRNEAEARQTAETEQQRAEAALKQESQALADLKGEKRKTADLLYATRINLSHREWQAGNAPRARQLLEDCPHDLRGWEWDFLKGLYDERTLVLNGHAGQVLGVALTPDGRRAVTFGNAQDGTVRVWDARTGASLHELRRTAHRLAVSPDGARAALAVGNRVQVLELATGRTLYSVAMGALPCGLGFVRDGADLAVALLGGEVRFLDPADGKERSRLGRRLTFLPATRALLAIGQGITFSPDGRWLGQGGTEGKLRVWDARTGDKVLDVTGHLIIVRQVAFSPDGRRLASAGGEGDIRVWDLERKQPVLRLTGHRNVVHGVAFSPDGRRLVSGSKDTTVRVWDLDTGENVLVLTGHSSEVMGVAFAGGNRAASAAGDSTARVWDVDERLVYGESVRAFFQGENLLDPARRGTHDALTFLGYLAPVWDLAFSPDGRGLATAGQLKPSGIANPGQAPEVTIWDLGRRRELHGLSVPEQRKHHLAYSPDGRLLVVGSSTGKRKEPAELNAFDTATGRRVWHRDCPPGLEVRPAFAPGGARLAAELRTAAGDSFLMAWEAKDGKELFRQPLKGGHTRATYSPDGRVLVTAGATSQGIVIEKYDAQTGRLQGSWPAGATGLLLVTCGPGGVVAAATWGNRPVIKLYRLADGHELGSLEGHVGAITALAFSPDGRRLISSASDFTVRVWHTGSGRELLTFREHTDSPQAVAWSPDGRRIGSAGHDRMIKVWEARPAEVPPRIDDWPPLARDDFAADGDLGPWRPLFKSPWEVRDGVLRGRQVNVTFPGITFPFAGAARAGLKLPRTVEVRFAYRAGRPLVLGVNLAAPDGRSSYTALLCGGAQPFGRPCTRLQHATEGVKNIFFVGRERPFAMRPGHWHRVRVVRQPERIRVYVDGVETLSEPIPDIELPHLALVGDFGAVGDEIEFKEVEVRAPAGTKR